MKVKPFLFYMFAAILLCSACGENDDCCISTDADYSKGIFVVNEGPFGGSGTISWHNPDTGETQDSLYEKANNGAELGQFVQSVSFVNDKAYIVVNGANRVVVVDAKTFRYLDTIGGLAQPRFFLPVNTAAAYVSQWGNDGLSGSLARIDLNTNTVVATVPVGHGPEKMLLGPDGILYVANSGGYGTDSTIALVNPAQAVLVDKWVTGGLNPANIANYQQSKLALCKGNYDPVNPKGSVLCDVNPVVLNIPVAPGADDLVSAADGSYYFVDGVSVWHFTNNMVQKLVDQPAYGLNLDQEANLLYCADAKGFTGPGEVVVYKTDGSKVKSFRCGVGPGEIVIRK